MSQPKKKSNRLIHFFIAVVLLLIGLLAGIFLGQGFINKQSNGYHQGQDDKNSKETSSPKAKDKKASSPEQAVLTVEVVSPNNTEVIRNQSADGTLMAKNTASVSSKVNGVAIESVMVQEGQWVDKGDVLATFDTKSFQQNVIQAEAAVRQAQANVKQTKANVQQSQASVVQAKVTLAKSQADLDRVLPLLKIGAVSQQEVDAYMAQLEQSKASLVSAKSAVVSVEEAVESAKEAVVSAQSQLNNQKLNFQDARLLSPVSGVVSEKNAQIGAVPQGSLFTIIENGALEWKAELNPELIDKIKIGTPVRVTTPTQQVLSGRVSRFDPVAGSNRQVSVYAMLKPQVNAVIQAGMLLNGEFLLGSDLQLVLPVASVVSSDGYDYLMLVTDLKKTENKLVGRVKRLKVELGEQFDDRVVIKTKLPLTAKVVRQGGSFLNDGDLVRVVELSNKTTDSNVTSKE